MVFFCESFSSDLYLMFYLGRDFLFLLYYQHPWCSIVHWRVSIDPHPMRDVKQFHHELSAPCSHSTISVLAKPVSCYISFSSNITIPSRNHLYPIWSWAWAHRRNCECTSCASASIGVETLSWMNAVIRKMMSRGVSVACSHFTSASESQVRSFALPLRAAEHMSGGLWVQGTCLADGGWGSEVLPLIQEGKCCHNNEYLFAGKDLMASSLADTWYWIPTRVLVPKCVINCLCSPVW